MAENAVHVHDLNATILHCLGIDHEKLPFKFQGVYMAPGVAGGVVYATVGEVLHAVDANTGEQKWTFQAESRILPTPVVANGVVYIATTKGFLYALH